VSIFSATRVLAFLSSGPNDARSDACWSPRCWFGLTPRRPGCSGGAFLHSAWRLLSEALLGVLFRSTTNSSRAGVTSLPRCSVFCPVSTQTGMVWRAHGLLPRGWTPPPSHAVRLLMPNSRSRKRVGLCALWPPFMRSQQSPPCLMCLALVHAGIFCALSPRPHDYRSVDGRAHPFFQAAARCRLHRRIGRQHPLCDAPSEKDGHGATEPARHGP